MGHSKGCYLLVGIPSFVVTLAGLHGYQGFEEILPTGNLNVGILLFAA